jgi:hypothetical protein
VITLLANVLDDTSKVVPIGGIAALLAMMLRMVWVNDAEQRRNESKLRAEFKIERDAENARHDIDLTRMRAEFDASIAALRTVHAAELESLERRIKLLRDEATERRRQDEQHS